jgi:hypothetical protein
MRKKINLKKTKGACSSPISMELSSGETERERGGGRETEGEIQSVATEGLRRG